VRATPILKNNTATFLSGDSALTTPECHFALSCHHSCFPVPTDYGHKERYASVFISCCPSKQPCPPFPFSCINQASFVNAWWPFQERPHQLTPQP
jgi:hypothetical protein